MDAKPTYWVYIPAFAGLWGARSLVEAHADRVAFDEIESAFRAFTAAVVANPAVDVKLGATLPSVFVGHSVASEVLLVRTNDEIVHNATYQSAAAYASNALFLADVEWLRGHAQIGRVIEYRRGRLVSTPSHEWQPRVGDPPKVLDGKSRPGMER